LRRELEDLRRLVENLEEKIKDRDREISHWSSRYWEEKIQKDKIVTIVKHYGDEDLNERVSEVVVTEEEAVAVLT
ncbi:MAG: hypothetical protein LC650_04975, partial [Actinobacteria bacterium]|nr:hypothetical protein [Actinomycetota bacterium]